MSERRFKFVSPGVFLKEIDQSQIPEDALPTGPVVIGRSQRGPAMTPVQVSSYSEFVETFGAPQSQQSVTDPWRVGNKAGTTYGAYAAKAWLKNNPTLTFIRLAGVQSPDASTTAAKAGWDAEEALGLFIFSSGSTHSHTGTLAAIIYKTDENLVVGLSGSLFIDNTDAYGNAAAISPVNSATSAIDAEFKLVLKGEVGRLSDASTTGSYVFNLNRNSKKFIRNVLNTDPVKTNSTIYSNTDAVYQKYFLGETFECSLDDMGAAPYFGVVMKLANAAGAVGHDFRYPTQKAETGWFIGQDLNENTASYNAENMQKLFKLRARTGGDWTQNNLKISIDNLQYSRISGSYGTFDVVLRKIDDTDNVLETAERFSGVSLDPSSPNYISRKIGDKYVTFDQIKLLNKEVGMYKNKSKFVYVEIDESVAAGTTNSTLLPFGVFGPLKYENTNFGSSSLNSGSWTDASGIAMSPFILGSGSVTNTYNNASTSSVYVPAGASLKFDFPGVATRLSASSGAQLEATNAFWGAYTGKTNSNAQFAHDVRDLVKARPQGLLASATSEDNQAAEVNGSTEWSWVFSLDNVSASLSGNRVLEASYADTNRTTGESVTSNTSHSWKTLIDKNIARFTTVMAGGTNGFDITEKEPSLREGLFTDSTYSAYNTAQRAIDLLTDPENVSFNLATFPGLKQSALTKRLVEKCENRADALAIIDLGDSFVSPPERTSAQTAAPTADGTIGNIDTAVSTYVDRQLDSSYACAYYPWVQALDEETNQVVYLPPSVVALGVMSKTDADRGPWFAPAGFSRGGLSDGDGGLPVLSTTEKLTSKDRDKLYDVGINPLATFPNEGVVIFGQKTLQADRSALDRINVRRMLIYVKSGMSRIATGFLFEPNVQDTWNRFLAQAEPFLTDVQQQYGIDEFKLILDKTTTTPDLIDQNILYAKLFIKPTRAIEFIAVDFFITNSGASFED
jgi:hypothetical protein